jgi:Flp pilus assembly secretin CpaC
MKIAHSCRKTQVFGESNIGGMEMTVPKILTLSVMAGLVVGSLAPPDARAQERAGVQQIEVEVQFVEFSASDIAPLAAKGIVDVDSLRGLREKGKGNLLSAPKLVTHSGTEATFKVVTEYIYPTELKVCPPTDNNTNAIAVTSQFAVVPARFETREVGVVLSVLPEVNRDGTLINLTMSPELVFEPEWKIYSVVYTDADGKERETHLEQPFFHTRAINTTLTIYNGATVLLGGGAMTAMPGKDKDEMMYIFLAARLVDAAGKPIDRE